MTDDKKDRQEFMDWMQSKYPQMVFTCWTPDMKNRLESWLASRKALRKENMRLKSQLMERQRDLELWFDAYGELVKRVLQFEEEIARLK